MPIRVMFTIAQPGSIQVYDLTEAGKYVLIIPGILVTSPSGAGLWFVSALQGQTLHAPVSIIFIRPSPLSHLSAEGPPTVANTANRLIEAILRDRVFHFFIIAVFHIAMAFFTPSTGCSHLFRSSGDPPILTS